MLTGTLSDRIFTPENEEILSCFLDMNIGGGKKPAN